MREMKDSGIKWVGSIPVSWKTQRVKHGFYRKKVEAHQDNPVVLSLARSGVRVRDISNNEGQIAESYYNYNPVDVDDLLINPMDLYSGANCSISKVKGVISQAYINLRYRDGYNPEYYDYYFKLQYWMMAFFVHGKGVSFENRWTLNADTLMNYPIIKPSYEEQCRIVDYLDEKCAKIDAIIEKKQEIIEKLKEYRLSVITEAVTKGLNPNVEMKDSGDNRIGYIPVTWGKIKITRLLDYEKVYPIGDGDHGLIKTNNYKEEGIPYIRVQNLGWGTDLLLDNVVYISEEDNEKIINSELHPNDILFCKTGATIGKTAIIPHEIKRANTTSHVGKITLDCKYNSRFIFYYLSSEIGYEKFWDIACMKSTRPELSIEEIKSINVAIPLSREEQDDIVKYLDNICSKIEDRNEKVEEMVKKLQDYKKSLIFEVVTGKKEV